MRFLSIALVIVFLLTGCVTAYNGPAPDFKLQGEAAQQEFSKFELHGSFWTGDPGYFSMGPEQKWVTADSLDPIMRSISPEAIDYERRGTRWLWGGRAVVLAATVYYFANVVEWEDSLPIFIGGIIVGTGFRFRAQYFHNRAIESFNRDMKQKFTPALTYNFEF